MPRPRSANPSPAALRMRALRAARKAGVERAPSPTPRTSTNVPPIEQRHEQTRMNVPETSSMRGPEPRGNPMPPEAAEVMFGDPVSVPISTPSPRGEPIQPLPEHQRPGFRGYRCYECPKEGFIEPKTLKDHLLKAHGYRDRGDGIPIPTQRTLATVKGRPTPARSSTPSPTTEGPWEKVPEWKQVVPKDEGWEKVPKPTHRELIEQGWTPAKGDDLIRDGWERVG